MLKNRLFLCTKSRHTVILSKLELKKKKNCLNRKSLNKFSIVIFVVENHFALLRCGERRISEKKLFILHFFFCSLQIRMPLVENVQNISSRRNFKVLFTYTTHKIIFPTSIVPILGVQRGYIFFIFYFFPVSQTVYVKTNKSSPVLFKVLTVFFFSFICFYKGRLYTNRRNYARGNRLT